jgi:hypothetical protein
MPCFSPSSFLSVAPLWIEGCASDVSLEWPQTFEDFNVDIRHGRHGQECEDMGKHKLAWHELA